MTKYTVRRVCMAFVTLLLVASITFFLMNAIPGNPWLSEKTPSEATIQALNAKYGLDQPKYIQLGKYLKNLAQGDFGTSIKMQKNRPVLSILMEVPKSPCFCKSRQYCSFMGSARRCSPWMSCSLQERNLGGQLFASAVYHRYFNAGICCSYTVAAYVLWRY